MEILKANPSLVYFVDGGESVAAYSGDPLLEARQFLGFVSTPASKPIAVFSNRRRYAKLYNSGNFVQLAEFKDDLTRLVARNLQVFVQELHTSWSPSELRSNVIANDDQLSVFLRQHRASMFGTSQHLTKDC